MRRRNFASWLVPLLVLASLPPPPARADCPANPAPIRLAFSGQIYEVPIRIGRTVLSFVLDTGAARSVIDRASAQRLHLASDPRHLSAIVGVGGRGSAIADVLAPQAMLGAVPLGRVRLAVGNLPASPFGQRRHDGVLGADILARFDVEVDFPARRLVLTDPGCHAAGPSWAAQAQVLGRGQDDGLIVVPVKIDGRDFKAVVDSGAAVTTLPRDVAELTGLSVRDLARDGAAMGQGAAGPRVKAILHRFTSLTVGKDVLNRPILAVVPNLPVAGLLLGLDYLHTRRLWIGAAPNRVLMSAPGR